MNIYVGNLSWNLKDQDLSNLFATHGEVVSAKIVTDKFTNAAKALALLKWLTMTGTGSNCSFEWF